MDIYYSDIFELPLPQKHRFPMSKYRQLRERILAADVFRNSELRIPPPATDDQLMMVHDREYVQRVIDGNLTPLEIKRIGFPWSSGLVERSRRSVGASIAAMKSALDQSVSVSLAGGTHHAFADAGQGYCVFNDVMVAAKVAQRQHGLRNVLVVDLDVHQGNGTAAIAAGDSSVFTFSMHCQKNYPFRKTDGDLDIGLPERTEDQHYLEELDRALAEIQNQFSPELIFYLAGADPFVEDRLGLLSLSKVGLAERDQRVIDLAANTRAKLVVVMAGGYAQNVEDIVDIHFNTVIAANSYACG